jgi:MoxR-like ATPase
MPTYKLFQKWSWALTQPAPFDTLSSGDLRRKDVYSKYSTGTRREATIHPSIMQAVFTYMNLENGITPTGDFTGAIGSQENDLTVCEYPGKSTLQVICFNRLNGRFFGGCYTAPIDEELPPLAYTLKDGHRSGAALFFSLLPTALAETEFNEHYQKLKEHQENGFSDMEETIKTAAVLSDNLYRRIAYPEGCEDYGIQVAIPTSSNLPPLKAFNLKSGTYAPTNVIAGTFVVLKKGTRTHAMARISHNDFIGKYQLSKRILKSSEEHSIPSLPSWYIIPPEVTRICEHARLTTDGQQPMRNFLLRGPAGTGKTEGAKAIAAGLHLPYRSITCSANTEIFDLLGQIIPDTEDSSGQMHTCKYPTLSDIQADPASAYYMLTGEYDEAMNDSAVYDMLLKKVTDNARNAVPSDNKQRFRYVDTPLVEAMRYGYVLELQEPTVISNPGVLVGLNSLLDRCNSVTLPNGEIINRHPDTVIVVTTNAGYSGCKDMNQSVISRMNLVMDIPEPTEDTLVARVAGITGCTDHRAIRLMAKLIKQISTYCKEAMITDGSCGVRELISWVQSFMICEDIMEAAHYTVLSSVSSDEDCRLEVQTLCLETELAS